MKSPQPSPNRSAMRCIRNGSRGLLFLEPLVEVETANGRVAYGPVTVGRRRLPAARLDGGAHKLRLGNIEDHPYLKNQERLTFARCGITDPLSVADYCKHGGFEGLKKALGLAGRPSWRKSPTRACAAAAARASPPASSGRRCTMPAADQKYVSCNADEGD